MEEIAIAKVNDVENRQMQQIAVKYSQILVSKVDDKFYATSSFCTHYDVSLEKKILCDKKIAFAWHNDCFSADYGEQVEHLRLDSLASFTTKIKGDLISVEVLEEIPQQHILLMAKLDSQADKQTFVILDAGIAGINEVETLCKQDFLDRIILVSAKEKLPYDRAKLSKNYLQDVAIEDSFAIRSCKFYDLRLRYIGYAEKWD